MTDVPKCPECNRPVIGRRDKVYCTRLCMKQAKDRRWREANQERISKYQRKYRVRARKAGDA